MEESRTHYKTIILSDIHIGSRWSHTKEAMEFLANVSCDKLILNGDIIDGWHLLRSRKKWKHTYNNFIIALLDMHVERNTEIVYVRGNHDDFLDSVIPFVYKRFSIVSEYIHISAGRRFFVFHGDMFDSITTNIRWLSKMGDKVYSFLLQINRHYNDYRRRNGMAYYSISMNLKAKVKRYVSKYSAFDKNIVDIARKRKCQGVICGHIHQADKRYIEEVLYLNSGDWIESLTALAEDENGEWEIINIQASKHKK